MNRTELIDKVRSGRDQLTALLAQLNDEQMLRPGLNDNWSGKDLLAHIAFWEWRAVHLFDNLARTGTVVDAVGVPTELNALNAKAYEDSSGHSLADVRHDEQKAYLAILAVAENASDDDLFNAERFAWCEGQPFINWITSNTYGHYGEHIQALQDWIKTVNAAPSR